ncbi:hypothetical protein [Cupriavidus malaysiensis]|uniref:Uncharacterized protein n=1 Tax=Cupriavidus malaysiensis TaxID=367825 RepID=A0ABN4TVT0_9BURK|nr:hypothetical protein [Cupriavidus malaysiensis]AOZ11118.1 hypothetical protein BKK80_34745 [Cupriavidus malaysiensis]
MSQHHFATTHNDRRIQVNLGWDRRLQYFFMVIDYVDRMEERDGEGYLYSSLDEDNAFQLGLEYFEAKLGELGITVPRSMFEEVRSDATKNVGNRQEFHTTEGLVSRNLHAQE